MPTLHDAAVSYVRDYGLAIHPLRMRDKRPATENGLKDATTDVEQVDLAWRAMPNLNIGMATGQPSGGIIVIDFIDMNLAENRQKLYERMCQNMQKDRAKHNILPLSKFGLMQITRQRVRPAMDVTTDETCPTCFGKGTIKSSILFTDTLESKIDYLVNKLKIKKFTLYIHPYIAAFVNQGFISMKRKWQMKYGFGIKVVPDQSLAFLQYKFTDGKKEEIDMKEEIEIK